MSTGAPFVAINDSGGARIQEGAASLAGYGYIFERNVRASGVIPQISVIMGPCAGGAVYSPAITDFTFMVRETSHMFITGPDVIKTVTGEDISMEALGGAMTHADRVGRRVVHRRGRRGRAEPGALPVELPAFEQPRGPAGLRRHRRPSTPRRGADPHRSRTERQEPYDMHEVIRYVVDDGEFLEVFPLWAMNIVIGFARLDGRSVGVIANQPKVRGGTLDIDASEKASALRALLRRVQHPDPHARRRARLPAGQGAGVQRHHPPRREAAVRLRRGDRAAHDGDHPQGLWRRVPRHEL